MRKRNISPPPQPRATYFNGETPDASQAPRRLPEHDATALLEPLPPGWVQTQHFTTGLHPSEDVFEGLAYDTNDLEDKPAPEQGEPGPSGSVLHSEGDPEHMFEEDEDIDVEMGEDPQAWTTVKQYRNLLDSHLSSPLSRRLGSSHSSKPGTKTERSLLASTSTAMTSLCGWHTDVA